MKLLDEQRLPLETRKKRALNALDPRHPQPASAVAHYIWPDHEMKPQGAGALPGVHWQDFISSRDKPAQPVSA